MTSFSRPLGSGPTCSHLASALAPTGLSAGGGMGSVAGAPMGLSQAGGRRLTPEMKAFIHALARADALADYAAEFKDDPDALRDIRPL